MVSTKHCCWGRCNTDSRYPDRMPKPLKELEKSGKKVFIPFVKPSQDIERCRRWIHACSRQNFTVNNITRNTYICALHWPGEKGPTEEFPDPLKATLITEQIAKAHRVKRKAPKQRDQQKYGEPCSKKAKEVNGEDCDSTVIEACVDVEENIDIEEKEENSEKATQTEISKYELATKVETIVLRNQLKVPEEKIRTVSNISYEVISKDPKLMKYFVGLTSSQFDILYDFLNDVCPLDSISFWGCKGNKVTKVKSKRRLSKWSARESLFICLLRLKMGFSIKTMSCLLSCSDREIKETTIRTIFTTYIQLVYKIFREMSRVIFPSKEHMRRFLPKVFKTIRNVRCSVDCTEFRVETSRNFSQQGNTFSSYKHANTFKCLIACTPNGGACFVSDLFEGDISDVQIFEESGILKHLEPQDVILVDRGFTVQHLVNPLQAKIKIPAFLKGRQSLTVQEELDTRKLAKARIHIERFNQRLKQFKLVGRKIPLSIAPLATQMVVVACGLVNFQEVLCK